MLKPLSRLSFAIYTFYFAITLVITFPLILNLSSQMIGHPTGDVYEMGHHIWWFKYALQNGEPIFWQTLSGHPEGFSAVSLWANPLQFFPAWLFSFFMPVASAYNLTVLLTMALNGWAMCWVMWQWLCGEGEETTLRVCLPALLAGLVYMAYPTMQGHLFGGHAGLLVAWGAPLYVYALFRLSTTPTRRWFALAVLFFLLTPSGHTLQLIYVLMPITAVFFFSRLLVRDWRGALRTFAVSIVGCLLLLIFVLPVFSDTFSSDTYTGDTGYIPFSLDVLAVVTPSFGHVLFGNLDYTHRVLGINLTEGSGYLGIIVAILALIGASRVQQARWWLVLAVIAWLLALGPVFKAFDQPMLLEIDGLPVTITPPWAVLYKLPGFSLARTPGRFAFTLALAVAALAGYGASALWKQLGRSTRANVVLGALMAVTLFEYQAFFPHYTVPAEVPTAIQGLNTHENVRAVMDMPWGNLLAAKQGLYWQTWHQKPLIAGQVTRRTPVSPAKLTLLEETLDPALLNAAGADVILLHKQYMDAELDQNLRSAFGAPSYEDEIVALFDVPEAQADSQPVSLVRPETDLETQLDSYLYTPSAGWMEYSGSLQARGRTVSLLLDGQLIYRWMPEQTENGAFAFTVPLPLDDAGYYTVSMLIDPPCPATFQPNLLRCRSGELTDVSLMSVADSPLDNPIQLDAGIALTGAYLPPEALTENVLPVRLWWNFTQPVDADTVRFVKVLDQEGNEAAGIDTASGPQQSGDSLAETLELDLSGLTSGTYEVYTGWYTYPDLTRIPVLSDVPGAPDNWILLGTVTIASDV
jgi:hypothetical protein